MKPAPLRSTVCHGMILGILIVCAVALVPERGWSQHGAPRAPHPAAPAGPKPAIARAPHAPLTSFHHPIAPFRVFAPSAQRRHFRFFPVIFWPRFFGVGYGAYWYPSCDGYSGGGYSCGSWSPYYSYSPEPVYSSGGYGTENLSEETSGIEGSDGEQLPRKILLCLRDGSVFGVASYGVADGKLHYVTTYGGQNDIDVDLIDVQKTIDENAARGVTFTLTPSSSSPAAPSPTPPSNQ